MSMVTSYLPTINLEKQQIGEMKRKQLKAQKVKETYR